MGNKASKPDGLHAIWRPAGTTFGGCWYDPAGGILPHDHKIVLNSMTPTLCRDNMHGYKFFALLKGNECYGTNDYGWLESVVLQRCMEQPCRGDKTVSCGGQRHYLVYGFPPSEVTTTVPLQISTVYLATTVTEVSSAVRTVVSVETSREAVWFTVSVTAPAGVKARETGAPGLEGLPWFELDSEAIELGEMSEAKDVAETIDMATG